MHGSEHVVVVVVVMLSTVLYLTSPVPCACALCPGVHRRASNRLPEDHADGPAAAGADGRPRGAAAAVRRRPRLHGSDQHHSSSGAPP